MSFLWKSQFVLVNVIGLALLKIVLPYGDIQWAAIDIPTFTAQDILEETNNYRVSSSLPILEENYVLDIAAAQKLQDMLQNQYFAHVSPSGISPWHWFEVNGYQYTFAGENLAIGFIDAQSTVQAWIDSPSHRQNLVDANYKQIGVAVAQGKIKDIEGNIVVQLFGTPVQKIARTTLVLSFSGTKAKEEPLQTPLEPPIIPLHIANNIAPSQSENSYPIEKVSQPSSLMRFLRSGFLIYSFLVALVTVSYLLIRGLTQQRLALTTLHVLIFYSTVYLPPLILLHRSFIG